MTKLDCRRIQDARARGAATRAEERHLFSCPDCRAQVRLAQAWRSMPRPETMERSEPVEGDFTARVLRAIRADRLRRSRMRASLAAAAALLFFFLAGAAGQLAASAASGAEEDYAQLIGPAGLDSLLPQ